MAVIPLILSDYHVHFLSYNNQQHSCLLTKDTSQRHTVWCLFICKRWLGNVETEGDAEAKFKREDERD